jgi:beta-galactosidase
VGGSSWTDKTFLPDVTSYDYDAPLDEAGHPTAKYHAYRELLTKYAASAPPAVPSPPPVTTIAAFPLQQAASLWANLPAPVANDQPQPMERLGQSYGYILYRRTLAPTERGDLELDAVHDYALVFLDGQRVGTLDRRLRRAG